MGTMKLRGWLIRLRQSVRQWLGTDDLPSATMLRALEAAQKARQAKLLDALDRIEKRLIAAHVEPTRASSFAPPVLDWELVQMMALKALEDEPQPKEQG
jgi:hypothetical protein